MAHQPVVDTLRLSHVLQESGVDRAQAEGMARALADEFGEHVVARGDLNTGFERVWSEFKAIRTDMDAEFKAMRTDMDAEFKAMRTDMDAEFKAVRSDIEKLEVRMEAGFEMLDSKFRYMMAGIGLMLAFLSAIAGLAVFDRMPSTTKPVAEAAWTAPAATGVPAETAAASVRGQAVPETPTSPSR